MAKHTIQKQTKYMLRKRDMLTEQNRAMIKAFCDKFRDYEKVPMELRIEGKEIRRFLEQYGVTLQTFNKMTSCLGRTTGNRYAYSIPVLLSIAEPAPIIERKYRRKFQVNRIKTINYYGSKRKWLEEYQLIFNYTADGLGCSRFMECFAGSGVLSLLASKGKKFRTIQANEASPATYNYHCVMKGEKTFQEFIRELEIIPQLNRDAFMMIRQNLYNSDDYAKDESHAQQYEGCEIRKEVQTADVKKAMRLYLIKHYAFQWQGGWSGTRLPPSNHIEALTDTHKLYEPIELTNLHYRKVLVNGLDEQDMLIVLDPPYQDTYRVQKRSYGLEFNERKHRVLIQLLSKEVYPAKIILCGYRDSEKEDMYSRYLKRSKAEWHCYQFLRSSVPTEDKKKEHIWTNFDMSCLCNQYPDMFKIVF